MSVVCVLAAAVTYGCGCGCGADKVPKPRDLIVEPPRGIEPRTTSLRARQVLIRSGPLTVNRAPEQGRRTHRTALTSLEPDAMVTKLVPATVVPFDSFGVRRLRADFTTNSRIGGLMK